MFIIEFLLWTGILYWMHRLVHIIPFLRDFHMDHHRVVNKGEMGWHWNNLFLFNDTWDSTIDLWVTEVIPTLIFSWITGAWWLSIFYYLWAATIQEIIEHRSTFSIPILTSGKWHMIHHRYARLNFSVFIPVWDIIFRTYAKTSYTK